jgi:hypothetical protein
MVKGSNNKNKESAAKIKRRCVNLGIGYVSPTGKRMSLSELLVWHAHIKAVDKERGRINRHRKTEAKSNSLYKEYFDLRIGCPLTKNVVIDVDHLERRLGFVCPIAHRYSVMCHYPHGSKPPSWMILDNQGRTSFVKKHKIKPLYQLFVDSIKTAFGLPTMGLVWDSTNMVTIAPNSGGGNLRTFPTRRHKTRVGITVLNTRNPIKGMAIPVANDIDTLLYEPGLVDQCVLTFIFRHVIGASDTHLVNMLMCRDPDNDDKPFILSIDEDKFVDRPIRPVNVPGHVRHDPRRAWTINRIGGIPMKSTLAAYIDRLINRTFVYETVKTWRSIVTNPDFVDRARVAGCVRCINRLDDVIEILEGYPRSLVSIEYNTC